MSHKNGKKIRKEVRTLKYGIAGELKGLINAMPLKDRMKLCFRILFRRKW